MSSSTPYRYWQLPEQSKRKGSQSLELKQADQFPVLQPDHVLVRIRAVSLNYRDVVIADNSHGLRAKDGPLIPVSDGAGEVLQVGERVSKFRQGERVVCNFNITALRGVNASKAELETAQGGPIDGLLSQVVALPAAALLRIPDSLSFEEAATLPCAAVTAWNALFGLRDVPLVPGATVVAEGTGGVSIFAAQLAIASGANVVVTSSSDEKLSVVKDLFTPEQQRRLFLVNYKKTPAWDKEVLKVNPEGASHVIDVGGAGTLEKAFASVKRGGVVANIGFVAEGQLPNIPMLNLVSGSIYRGIYVGSVELFEQLLACVETEHLKPLIDKTFDFEDTPKAYEHLASQSHVGKVVIRL